MKINSHFTSQLPKAIIVPLIFKGHKTVSLCALRITDLTKHYLMSTTEDFDVTFLKSLDYGKSPSIFNPKIIFYHKISYVV
jgi:hypothetical protein